MKQSNWKYTPEGIRNTFVGNHDIWTSEQRYLLFVSLLKLPRKIIDFSKNIFFISGHPEGSGAQGIYIKDKIYVGIIHFQPLFWKMPGKKIEDGVVHEVAHMYLGHRRDAPIENKKEMEIEADKLASKWLKRKVTVGQNGLRKNNKER